MERYSFDAVSPLENSTVLSVSPLRMEWDHIIKISVLVGNGEGAAAPERAGQAIAGIEILRPYSHAGFHF
eukprot:627086-Prorocentrum_minimum.AAC.1